jgi:fatty-acyl-CoA synthase
VNFSRIAEHWAAQRPEKVALHFHGGDITYRDLWRRVEAATAALGVGRGERVAYLGYNSPRMLVLLFALARLGAILVPLNWRLTAAELRAILADCAPRCLVAEPELEAQARELGVPLGPPPSPAAKREPDLRGEDACDALIMYTSGTTGRPKGAVLTQAALLWNGFNAIHAHDLSQADHVLSPLPMFHVGGLNIQTLPALQAGATVTLERRFEPGQWLADVAARRPTLSLLVPAAMQAVIRHPDWARTDLSSLRMINSGSMVVPLSLIQAFHDRGVAVGQIYGCTETAPIATALLREDARRKAGSAGRAAAHCEIRLAQGEVQVRGPNVMRGYWNDEAATRAAFDGAWFRTGDLGRLDDEGFLWIVGRSKDVIISGGENIHPAELENVLADSPAIAECAVIGVEDPKWGEAPCACIVLRPGASLTEAEVLALFRDRLARYKHPRRVVFLDSLPKSALGKVQKPELRRRLGFG